MNMPYDFDRDNQFGYRNKEQVSAISPRKYRRRRQSDHARRRGPTGYNGIGRRHNKRFFPQMP